MLVRISVVPGCRRDGPPYAFLRLGAWKNLKVTTDTAYRPDIDGLRAVAVLSVVAFHLSPNLLRGGFTGVDVFFVISGFLITSIILKGLGRGSFSLLDFYARRIRRILPALLLVLVAVCVAGWFLLFDGEYRVLGKHVAGATAFLSNVIYWGESGYFDKDAKTKVLLHLWSLGIEEQFYVVWPALLMLVSRFRHGIVAAIVVTIVLSFTVNIHLTGRAPAEAFYSPASRAWELMVGCALAWLVGRGWQLRGAPAQAASAAGFGLLAAGFLLPDHASAFPGWWALLPTLGAFLVIAAGPQALPNRLILANRAAVAVGLISYPLYLWHWPLLAFVRIVEAGTPSVALRLTAVGVAFVAATATYLLVERPIRNARWGRDGTALGLLGGAVAMGAAGFLCYSMGGFPGLRPLDPQREAFVRHFDNAPPDWHFLRQAGLLATLRDECNFYNTEAFLAGHATSVPKEIARSCTERDPARRHTVMLWGDSHAQHLYWGLARNLPADWQILQVATSACTPELDAVGPSATNFCQQSNWTALQTIARVKPDVVILAHGAGQTARRFDALDAALKKLGVKRTLIVGPTPHWLADFPTIVARRLWPDTPRRTLIGANGELRARNEGLKRHYAGSGATAYVDVQGTFCNDEGCLVYLGDDRTAGLTSNDDGHLLPVASDYLAKKVLVPLVVDGIGN